ncbi:MAG: 2-C-methyl-D-erythritol 2,4-cyclodiphosphate synthase, partial [Chloroflexi bacterium]|nr:2-C-methyl-D-erythritol 2,4-cyclodiphosphate synthase [Chloroflexota bacterium]
AAGVGGRPLIAWTLATLAAAPEVEHIVLVVPAERVAAVREAAWLPAGMVEVVAGGARRQESVAAGVAAIASRGTPPDRVVLVHDAARPLIDAPLIARVAAAARRHGAAIPVVTVADTLKRIDGDRVRETVDRSDLAAAQTPQGARLGLLQAAYARFPPATSATWTDEAALLEACTIAVHVVPGDPRNLKVTVPDDLDRVRSALAPGGEMRLGFGHDSHPFGPGGPLRLGGVTFAGVPRLTGHSDGDVALHAVADALLGGAALGDLGRQFPATSATPLGVHSTDLLAAVRAAVAQAGYRPTSVDVTIVGARPRFGSRLEDMRDAIAGLLGLERARVSVKASSGNLVGAEGAGRSVSAHAVAALEPGA